MDGMVNELNFPDRKLVPDPPCFVIAEAGVNHNGDIELARQLVNIAASCGADAVKFQTFKAERLMIAKAPKADYQKQNTSPGESQFDMLQRLELSDQSYGELREYATAKGIEFLSTPFDEESADLLDSMGLAVFKIGSGELTNLPFLEYVARKRKPMILSTGMGALGEVEAAVEAITRVGNQNLVLLHCVSQYPADPRDANLRAMRTLSEAFGFPVGFSDHTEGNEVAFAAVALGARVIEKHFTLDRGLPGPDHRASAEPRELAALVQGIRKVELCLGNGRKQPTESELNTAAVARKSLVAARNIAVGEIFTEDLVRVKRPGTGLPPCMRSYILGRVARVSIPEDTLLSLEMIS
jgi:N,N'-diacetyllegionaminate synthase